MRTADVVEDNVHITDEAEVMAAWEAILIDGALDGYVYADGEIWISRKSLERWRADRAL